MPSFNRVLGLQLALAAGILAPACQRDSDVNFDDSQLGGLNGAGTSSGDPDADASAGDGAGGAGLGTATAGTDSGNAAGKAQGGKPATSSGGTAAGGKGEAGKAGMPGTAGMSVGGTGVAGSSLGGSAGMAGMSNPVPDPVTVDTRDIDDTYVAECRSGENLGTEARVVIDMMPGDKFNDQCRVRALFNAPLPKVPAGAKVTKVTLTLTCLEAGGAVTVSYVEEPWAELMVRWYDSPKLGATLGTTQCSGAGTVSINLTDAALAWLGGKHANYGVYLSSESTDGTEFASSEAKAEASRPVLSLTYVPAAK